ncbi:small ribosomal subunit protein uS9m [Cornus florida]|uniref:small ribosomal subunit protein uS9m n=1 Tax=Cornus florida TaxID=4283 RepID=UPI002898636F|nr:small ribosomal subunit protein uS9m [Cornus florida]
MLSRFVSRHSQLRLLTLIASPYHSSIPKSHSLHTLHPPLRNPNFNFFFETSRRFSSNRNNNSGDNSGDQPTSTSDLWNLSTENDDSIDSVFGDDTGNLEGFAAGEMTRPNDESWLKDSRDEGGNGADIFKGVDKEIGGEKTVDDWATAEGNRPWSFGDKEKEKNVFNVGDTESEVSGVVGEDERLETQKSEDERVDNQKIEDERVENQKSEDDKELEREEKALSAVLKGPDRAFGDLIAASGITEEMLDGLMIMKDVEDIQGLPPLSEIEDLRYEKNTRKSTKGEIERQKQEEVAKARVVKVDAKGRAYGTGKRKCSIARVWIQPGEGEFIVNDKQFDIYFPMLDHRAALLRPFSETKTLGHWDVKCTVKGGGFSGQVGAIRLGISRALQNFEPGLRPPLKAVGFLTRDARVVERKKPGKAKARKSFQWVKR